METDVGRQWCINVVSVTGGADATIGSGGGAGGAKWIAKYSICKYMRELCVVHLNKHE